VGDPPSSPRISSTHPPPPPPHPPHLRDLCRLKSPPCRRSPPFSCLVRVFFYLLAGVPRCRDTRLRTTCPLRLGLSRSDTSRGVPATLFPYRLGTLAVLLLSCLESTWTLSLLLFRHRFTSDQSTLFALVQGMNADRFSPFRVPGYSFRFSYVPILPPRACKPKCNIQSSCFFSRLERPQEVRIFLRIASISDFARGRFFFRYSSRHDSTP